MNLYIKLGNNFRGSLNIKLFNYSLKSTNNFKIIVINYNII
jgi:hypothetical protein